MPDPLCLIHIYQLFVNPCPLMQTSYMEASLYSYYDEHQYILKGQLRNEDNKLAVLEAQG